MQFEHFTSESIIGFAASQKLTFTHARNTGCAILRKFGFRQMLKCVWDCSLPMRFWNGEDELFLVNTLVPVAYFSVFLFYAWHPIILRDSYPDFHFFVCSICFYKVWLGKLRFEKVALEHNQSSKNINDHQDILRDFLLGI